MTAFVKIEDGVVVQKQPYSEEGFVEAPDDVVCGFLAEDGVFSAPPTPPVDPAPYRLYRSVLVRRLTNVEAASLEVLLNSEEPYLRLLYNSSDYFMSDDALFAYLATVLHQALGEARASQILAPEG